MARGDIDRGDGGNRPAPRGMSPHPQRKTLRPTHTESHAGGRGTTTMTITNKQHYINQTKVFKHEEVLSFSQLRPAHCNECMRAADVQGARSAATAQGAHPKKSEGPKQRRRIRGKQGALLRGRGPKHILPDSGMVRQERRRETRLGLSLQRGQRRENAQGHCGSRPAILPPGARRHAIWHRHWRHGLRPERQQRFGIGS